jgi:hypothetical protein
MKLENKSDYTINFTRKALIRISQKANLDNARVCLCVSSVGFSR